MVLWLRLCAPNAEGRGSIPEIPTGFNLKIPCAATRTGTAKILINSLKNKIKSEVGAQGQKTSSLSVRL